MIPRFAIFVFAVAASSCAGFGKPLLRPGVYPGMGYGYAGEIRVSVAIRDGRIDSIMVEAQRETPSIGDSAIEELRRSMEAANSASVDFVAGATETCRGFSDAVENALAAAEADVQVLEEDRN